MQFDGKMTRNAFEEKLYPMSGGTLYSRKYKEHVRGTYPPEYVNLQLYYDKENKHIGTWSSKRCWIF